MSDLRELYQQLIIDHGRNPRNFYECHDADYIKEGYNPLCGDELTVYIFKENNKIKKACFYGTGCAISIASASLMCEALKDRTLEQAMQLFSVFHQFMIKDNSDISSLGKLKVLTGVKEFPVRIKCATLAWHTMVAALKGDENPVTTENLISSGT